MAMRFNRKTALGVLLAFLFVYVGLMIVESRKPHLPAVRAPENHPQGYIFVSMIVDLVEAQLEGPGGWTVNDLPLSPGYWLDNLPSFQLGVLSVVRPASVILRDDLGRGRAGDVPPPELALAADSYAADLQRWSNPSAESMLQRGNDALVRFRRELGGRAQVYPRADSVRRLVEAFAQELDAVDGRLLLARGRNAVPWYEVDDNLYYAQGTAFAQLGLLQAMRADFAGLFPPGELSTALDTAVAALADSQFEPWIVTNGGRSSLLANHSATLRTILEDARRALATLAAGMKR
ncbi:MAG: DUF2333 family protein [SAR324 cluster bacterium]